MKKNLTRTKIGSYLNLVAVMLLSIPYFFSLMSDYEGIFTLSAILITAFSGYYLWRGGE